VAESEGDVNAGESHGGVGHGGGGGGHGVDENADGHDAGEDADEDGDKTDGNDAVAGDIAYRHVKRVVLADIADRKSCRIGR
jgi:hypothetical protein